MDNLRIRPTLKTPIVDFNIENGELFISGRSLPEDAREFYDPLKNWLQDYFHNMNSSTTFTFEIYYFNTASSKMILDIFYIIKDAIIKGNNVKIRWEYHVDDEEMLEAGEDYAAIIKEPFELCPVDKPTEF